MKLLVISSYPEKNLTHGKTTVGVASYTKNTIDALKKTDPNIKVTTWSESNQTWQRNSFLSFFKLCLKLTKSHHDHLFLPHEFNMFGSPKTIIFFPLILLINKLKKTSSTLILHQVVSNFQKIAQHANIPKSLIPLINLLSKYYYSLIIKLSTNTIVFEEFLKQRLPKNLHKKITVIPHAVQDFKNTNTKQNINQINLLTFGYLAHYKGTDWLIRSFKSYLLKFPNEKLHLTIAGGPNPNHLSKPSYRKYLNQIKILAQHPQITLTGFVKERDIPKVFSNAKLVIFPYRTAMSSSGPLSIALSFHKPIIISKPLQKYTQTQGFQGTSFKLTQKSFNLTLNNILKNKQVLQDLTDISKKLAKTRSWNKIARQYLQQLTTN